MFCSQNFSKVLWKYEVHVGLLIYMFFPTFLIWVCILNYFHTQINIFRQYLYLFVIFQPVFIQIRFNKKSTIMSKGPIYMYKSRIIYFPLFAVIYYSMHLQVSLNIECPLHIILTLELIYSGLNKKQFSLFKRKPYDIIFVFVVM